MTWLPLALDPEPGPARDLLTRELARSEYQPTLAERIQEWLDSLFGQATRAAQAAAHPSPVVAVVLLVVLVALVVLVLTRLQRSGAARSEAAEVFTEGRLGAAQHRDLARRALDEGRPDEALREAVRALAAGLIERRLLLDEPGTTTREITDRCGALFPAERSALETVARAFEESVYGDRPADDRQARSAIDLERRVREASPSTDRLTGPVAAVPR